MQWDARGDVSNLHDDTMLKPICTRARFQTGDGQRPAGGRHRASSASSRSRWLFARTSTRLPVERGAACPRIGYEAYNSDVR